MRVPLPSVPAFLASFLHARANAPLHTPHSKLRTHVPVAGLTTASLVVAGAKLRRRDSASLNNWLRVRVLMQGLTVVAVVGGSWWYGQMKHQKEAAAKFAAEEQDKLIERLAFENRLRAAEEADRLERLEEEVLIRQTERRGNDGGSGGWLGGWRGSGKGSA